MTTFSKRHYEAIASVMQDLCPDLQRRETNEGAWEYDDEGLDHDALGRQLMWDDMLDELAKLFKSDNGNFARKLFDRACYPAGAPRKAIGNRQS